MRTSWLNISVKAYSNLNNISNILESNLQTISFMQESSSNTIIHAEVKYQRIIIHFRALNLNTISFILESNPNTIPFIVTLSFILESNIGTIQYNSRVFSISHPSQWADLFAPCNPTQGSTQTLTVILWYSPCDPPAIPCVSTQMGGITGGYKFSILSTQVKQSKVHRILITPLQSHSKLHWKIPMFSLQCFHRNGWNHRGVKNLNLPLSFITHWDGREIEKKNLELYCTIHSGVLNLTQHNSLWS